MSPLDRLKSLRDARGLSATDKVVLAMLISRSSADGESWSSVDRLAADAGLRATATRSALRRLRQLDVVRVDAQPGRTNRMHVDDAALLRLVPTPSSDEALRETKPFGKRSPTPSPNEAAPSPGVGAPSPNEPEVVQEVDLGSGPKEVVQDLAFALRAPRPKQAASKQRTKTEKPTPLGYQELVAYYCATYEQHRGVKVDFTNRHGKAAKDLLSKFSLDDTKAMLDRAFADGQFFDGELFTLANKTNKYRGTVTTTQNRNGRALQPMPETLPDWAKEGGR